MGLVQMRTGREHRGCGCGSGESEFAMGLRVTWMRLLLSGCWDGKYVVVDVKGDCQLNWEKLGGFYMCPSVRES